MNINDYFQQAVKLIYRNWWDEVITLVGDHPELAVYVDADGLDYSLLHCAAVYDGAYDLIDYLLKLGANPSLSDGIGATPLGNAIRSGHRYGVDTNRNIELLVAAGANLRLFDETGDAPLHAAISERRHNIVRLLLEAGADPFQKNNCDNDAFSCVELINDFSMKSLIEEYVSSGNYRSS
jgi:ankyrin repeat protein